MNTRNTKTLKGTGPQPSPIDQFGGHARVEYAAPHRPRPTITPPADDARPVVVYLQPRRDPVPDALPVFFPPKRTRLEERRHSHERMLRLIDIDRRVAGDYFQNEVDRRERLILDQMLGTFEAPWSRALRTLKWFFGR